MTKGMQTIRQAPTGAQVQATFNLLDKRWAMRVVWELRGGPRNFRQIQADCGGISPSVLQRRLHEARAAGLIERVTGMGYRLTSAGDQLFRILAPLDDWALKYLDC